MNSKMIEKWMVEKTSRRRRYRIERVNHLWFQVTMNDSLAVNVMDTRQQFLPDASRLAFAKEILLSNALQKFTSFQQFRDDVRVRLK